MFQDNYTFAQPGIQNKVKALEELVSRIDGEWTVSDDPCGASHVQLDLRLLVLYTDVCPAHSFGLGFFTVSSYM